MRKLFMTVCCVAAIGFATVGEAVAYEAPAGKGEAQITEHHWGRGYHRGGGRGYRGGCGGGYYYGG